MAAGKSTSAPQTKIGVAIAIQGEKLVLSRNEGVLGGRRPAVGTEDERLVVSRNPSRRDRVLELLPLDA